MEIYIKIAENWWKIIKKMKCKFSLKKSKKSVKKIYEKNRQFTRKNANFIEN